MKKTRIKAKGVELEVNQCPKKWTYGCVLTLFIRKFNKGMNK